MDPLRKDSEHDDLAQRLSDLGRLEREERAAADALADAPGLADVERVLAGAWNESRAPRARRWPLVLGVLAAAALVLFLLGRFMLPAGTGRPTDEFLNDGVFRIRHPAGLEQVWPQRIEWSGPQGASYRLRVVEELEGGAERTLLDPGPVAGFHYPLSEQETRTWPTRVKIILELKQKDGRRERTSDRWELRR